MHFEFSLIIIRVMCVLKFKRHHLFRYKRMDPTLKKKNQYLRLCSDTTMLIL